MINSECSPSHEEQVNIQVTAQDMLIRAEQIVGKWDECSQFLSASWTENREFFSQLRKFAENNGEFFSDDLFQRVISIDRSVSSIGLKLRAKAFDIASTPIPYLVQKKS